MSDRQVIAVAMSGGVDSSVAAAVLSETGPRVFGLMLRLWSAGERYPNRCCSPSDMANARRVADRLGIPFYVLDAQEAFRREVVEGFVDGYRRATTPNPCLACNRQIRWGLLRDRALALGATHLATGHYARVTRSNGRHHLYRARDRDKDQSYVLSVLGQPELEQSLFPLGDMLKQEVRDRAAALELETADREESQDLCFLGGGDYRDFLAEYAELTPTAGAILDTSGTQIGTHHGLHNYTIGQRKGIGVSGPEPLYVIGKDLESNALQVGPRAALGRESFDVRQLNWVSGAPPRQTTGMSVQIRYRARPARCSIRQASGNGRLIVELDEPLHAVTPGQAAVFYRGEECLGGGIIAESRSL